MSPSLASEDASNCCFNCHRYCGQLAEAEALLNTALAIWRACADEGGAAATLHELGVVRELPQSPP